MSTLSLTAGRSGLRAARLRRGVGALPAHVVVVLLVSRAVCVLAGAAGTAWLPNYFVIAPPAPSHQLGAVGNLLGGGAVRWDSIHYLAISEHGYTAMHSVFFPLYPLLIRLFAPLAGSPAGAGILISLCAFAGAVVVIHRLAEIELGRSAADATVLLICVFPLSFFFSAVYTESLFLLVSAGALLAARTQRWATAAGLAALAALTRNVGILLVVPLAIWWWQSPDRRARDAAWLLLPAAAVALYLGSLELHGISWRAPFSQETAWMRHSTGPLVAAWLALRTGVASAASIVGGAAVIAPSDAGLVTPDADSVWLLAVLSVSALLVLRTLRRLPLAYGAYAVLSLALVISAPNTGQPLASVDRYVLVILPLWMMAGETIARRGLGRATVAIGLPLLAVNTAFFAAWAFIA